jgi:hypothetical protein
MNSRNIFYFHIGQDVHLVHSLKQSRYTNPNVDIFLVGDNVPEEAKQIANFYSYKDLLCEQSQKLIKNYVNYSSNNANFELICILRWLLFRNLAKKLDLQNLFCLDSDMLLYASLSETLSNFDSYRYTLSNGTSAAVMCVNDLTVLDNFCDLVDGFYDSQRAGEYYSIDNKPIKKFHHIRDDMLCSHNNRLKNGLLGGICDMTFWGVYKNMDEPSMTGEISAVVSDSTFDHNINSADCYEMEGGKKKIVWIDGVPYCKNIFLDKMIRFNTLHFQGYETKRLMKNYTTYDK